MSTTAKERAQVIDRLQQAGISYADACQLRRISMTLQRWSALECGTEHGAIERDEVTGKPYMRHGMQSDGKVWRYPVRDRENGALKRLQAIASRYPQFIAYHQGDPRGAALFLVAKTDIPEGKTVDSYYSRGIAIY